MEEHLERNKITAKVSKVDNMIVHSNIYGQLVTLINITDYIINLLLQNIQKCFVMYIKVMYVIYVKSNVIRESLKRVKIAENRR